MLQTPDAPAPERRERMLPYLLMGMYLGFVFTRAEVVSWFRIQEMFRFQSFHMYGIIGSAVAVAAVGVWAVKRFAPRSYVGPEMQPCQQFDVPGYRLWMGGTLFGLGWGLLGACPGPIYVLIGNGLLVMVVALLAALVGVQAYALLKPRLPH